MVTIANAGAGVHAHAVVTNNAKAGPYWLQ